MKRLLSSIALASVVTASLGGAASAQSARPHARKNHLSVKAWVSPRPVKFHQHATLFGKTTPGALCTAFITYSTGRTRTQFGMLQTNGRGKVSWRWREAAKAAKTGTATVQCTMSRAKGKKTVTFRVKK